jgi:hypothetical protein
MMKNINQYRLLYLLMLLTCGSLSLGSIDSAHAQSPGTPTNSSASPSPASSPVVSTAPTVTNTDNPMTPNQKDESSLLDKSLPWISTVLHAIELLGLVTFMILLKDVKQQSKERDRKLSEKIAALENILGKQQQQLGNLDAGVSSIKQSTARTRAAEQNFPSQSVSGNLGTPAGFFPNSRPEQMPSAPIANSEYPFLELYQQSTDAFKQQYSPMAVSEDSENLQRRWAGEQQEIILGEDRQGNYWLVQAANTTYLVPSPKLKVNDMNMRTAGGLFECTSYNPGYRTMKVVKPAIVSAQSGLGNQRWKLEQKGVLEFT